MRVVIAGSRDFDDYELLKRTCTTELLNVFAESIEIVSGGAKGADALGERFAQEHNIMVTRFNADWNKYGKAAGPIRNVEMANYSNMLIAFWDGKSRGTKSMIEYAHTKGLVLKVIRY